MFYKDKDDAAKHILGKMAGSQSNQEGAQPEESHDMSDMEGLHSAAKDMIEAFHSKDHEAMTQAMDSFIEQHQNRKEKSGPEDQSQEEQAERAGEEG